MKALSFIAAIIFSLSYISTYGQDTGRFQKDIQFDEDDYKENRTLYYYVPEDYDSSQKYKLVVGLRGGPHTNAGQFRDQLTFLADSINAIIMCPENIAHFNTNEGQVKQLYRYSLDTAMSSYNIDPDFIYLTGLSFGGRHSVIVSMDTDDGDIPKLRGVIPFATGRDGQLVPNYDAIDRFAPACICIGESDAQIFKNVADDLYTGIVNNGGKAFLNSIPNVGHTVAFATYPTEMMKCLNWIEDNQGISSTDNINEEEYKISIHPNPVEDFLNWQSDLPSIRNVAILNVSGQEVLASNPSTEQINVSNLSRGQYILALKNDNGFFYQKFIKQ